MGKKQCCGTGFNESVSRYGFGTSISSESGSKVLMTKIEEKNTAEIFKNLF
jgi:hypothetical protein